MNKITKKLKRRGMGLFVNILVGIIFGLAYLSFITSFFQDWESFIFLIHGPSLAYITIISFMLVEGFGIKKTALKIPVILGSVLLLIGKLIEIILQKYNAMEGAQGVFYWAFSIILGFVGFLFLLFSFKGVKK